MGKPSKRALLSKLRALYNAGAPLRWPHPDDEKLVRACGRVFGSWTAALDAAGIPPRRLRLKLVRRVRAAYARGSSIERLAAESGLSEHTIVLLVGHDLHPEPQADRERRERVAQSHRSKLTAPQIASLRERFAAGEDQCVLAGDFGLSTASVSRIVRGVSHTHAPGPTFPLGRPRSRVLTREQIHELEHSTEPLSQLAQRLGVTRQFVQEFRRRWGLGASRGASEP
ncbi:MAG: hypothetical protein K8H88_27200 [Sandaracinaceae bacterium]|nr:hypothetical protein [Sandaracinaceae bacterium]